MKIVRCKWFPPKGYSAMMLVWWLIVKEGYQVTQRLITHETIHSKQQKEMLVVPFFIWYGVEFLVRLIQYRNWDKAYRNISFEREAYSNQGNKEYLDGRGHFAWIRYIVITK
jgi:hypothetical protein